MESSIDRFTLTAGQLKSAAKKINVFAGMDGFVDEIFHVVDKRANFVDFSRVQTISNFGERVLGAAGLSSNIELVSAQTKLGGNGPIFSNAINEFGASVVYAGCLGKPSLHPVFKDFSEKCEVYSICEPGYTDALEFNDGKIMLGKHKSLSQVNWDTFKRAMGGTKNIADKINNSHLIAMANWTMLPFMSEIWEGLINEVFPLLHERETKPIAFFDLADPEKRTTQDLFNALKLISSFESNFQTILGLNEKEAWQVVNALNIQINTHNNESAALADLIGKIYEHMDIYCVVVHPVKCAAAQTENGFFYTDGVFCEKPLLTTGAGDNFNAGFCYAMAIGLDAAASLVAGVSTSGFYVRNAVSPTLNDLCKFMEEWK